MQAIISDPAEPQGLRFGEVPEPQPGTHEALIGVHAFTLNFTDVAFLEKRGEPGSVFGIETAGTVLTAAADGSGPPVGARVAGFGSPGGWAERRALNVDQLAAIPEALDFGAAAALPVVGVTALRALRGFGALVGRRLLITGASGGVGRMAVQLAARAGAHVVACVGRPERGAGLKDLGAAEVVVGLSDVAPVYGVLENVGGALLAEAYARLEPDGVVQSVGMASLEPSSIDFEQARLRGGGRIEAFNVFSLGTSFSQELDYLLELAADGSLDPQIGWRGSWTQVVEAVGTFKGRQVAGKAVLDIVR